MVRFAVDQVIEVVANGIKRLQHGLGAFFFGGHFSLLEIFEQTFKRIGKLGDAIQSDNGECTANLVQVGPGELDLGGVAARSKLTQRFGSAFERKINLALDPGQWADVEFHRGVHARLSLQSGMVTRP